MKLTNDISFKELLDILRDDKISIEPRFLFRLSDLEGPELALLKDLWPELSLERRQDLMESLEEYTARDTLVSFENVCQIAVADDETPVRLPAIRILWESENPKLIPLFMDIAVSDPDPDARACATMGLGRFVYFGELDKIPSESLTAIEELLLRIIDVDEQPLVRRRALESLGFSSRQEVPQLIQEAYYSGDDSWIASAAQAMGRSADPRWNQQVLEILSHSNPLVRLEAVRAAGELEIAESSPDLFEHLEDFDEEVARAAVWSLSQIGGRGVRETLIQLLQESEADEEIRFLEEALDNLMFTEGFDPFALFDFDDEDLTQPMDERENEDHSF